MNFNIFNNTEKKHQLKPNPAIIINFCADEQAEGHAILVGNVDDYKVNDKFVDLRRTYYCYPRTVDNNAPKSEQEKIAKTRYSITVPHGSYEIIGKGMFDKNRTIIFLYPQHEKDMPDIFKQGEYAHHSLGIMRKRMKMEFMRLLQKQDIEASKLLDQTSSVFRMQVMNYIKSFSEELSDIKKTFDQYKPEQNHRATQTLKN